MASTIPPGDRNREFRTSRAFGGPTSTRPPRRLTCSGPTPVPRPPPFPRAPAYCGETGGCGPPAAPELLGPLTAAKSDQAKNHPDPAYSPRPAAAFSKSHRRPVGDRQNVPRTPSQFRTSASPPVNSDPEWSGSTPAQLAQQGRRKVQGTNRGPAFDSIPTPQSRSPPLAGRIGDPVRRVEPIGRQKKLPAGNLRRHHIPQLLFPPQSAKEGRWSRRTTVQPPPNTGPFFHGWGGRKPAQFHPAIANTGRSPARWDSLKSAINPGTPHREPV